LKASSKIEDMNEIELYLLDMDGTVYVENRLIDGAKEKIEEIVKKGKKFCFLTNNSSRDKNEYISKLSKLDININTDQIYTSGDSAIRYLKKYEPNKSVYLLGTQKLQKQFCDSGITLTQTKPDIVLVAYDTELTYEKLAKAVTFIAQGAKYMVTHADINCPASPVYVPDVGSLIALIEKSCGKLPELNCGKPYAVMAEAVAEKFGLTPNQIAMVGDRLYTDMMFAINNSFCSVLVLSGETTLTDYENSDMKIDHILNSIKDLEI